MKIFPLNLDSFGERIQRSQVESLKDGNADDGYILISETLTLNEFIVSQLSDPQFFETEPLYTLRPARR